VKSSLLNYNSLNSRDARFSLEAAGGLLPHFQPALAAEVAMSNMADRLEDEENVVPSSGGHRQGRRRSSAIHRPRPEDLTHK